MFSVVVFVLIALSLNITVVLIVLSDTHFFGIELIEILKNLDLISCKFQFFSHTLISSLVFLIFCLPILLYMTIAFLILRLIWFFSVWIWVSWIYFYFLWWWLAIFWRRYHTRVIRINFYSILRQEIAILIFGYVSQFTAQLVCLVAHYVI